MNLTDLTALHREWSLALLTLKRERQILDQLVFDGAADVQLDDQRTRVLTAEQAEERTRSAYQASFTSPGRVS